MTGQVLRVAVRGGVATLTLDSPANRNALPAPFFASDEGQEGMAAFREKRPARWVPA
jgi:enoyl-CoA hydratase/carnithine racemase